MFDSRNAAIIDICRSYELVEESVLKNLLASSEELSRSVAGLLVDQGHVSREILVERVANFLGLGYRAEAPADISQEVVGLVSVDLARMYGVVPIESRESEAVMLALDPFNDSLMDDTVLVTKITRGYWMRLISMRWKTRTCLSRVFSTWRERRRLSALSTLYCLKPYATKHPTCTSSLSRMSLRSAIV